MADIILLTPAAGASTNPLSLSFSGTVELQFIFTPEDYINKNTSGLNLYAVNEAGVVVEKSSNYSFIPWANIAHIAYT